MTTTKKPPKPRRIAKTPRDGQHAHPKPGAPPVEERVDALLEMMAKGEYRGMSTVAKLAEQWGVSSRTVEAHAAEASRSIKRELDRDALTGFIVSSLARVMSTGKDTDVVKAADVLAKVTELYTKKTSTTLDIPPSQMTPEQARAALPEAINAALAVLGKDGAPRGAGRNDGDAIRDD